MPRTTRWAQPYLWRAGAAVPRRQRVDGSGWALPTKLWDVAWNGPTCWSSWSDHAGTNWPTSRACCWSSTTETVRWDIAPAIEHGILIVPALLRDTPEHATPPDRVTLPASIRKLADYQVSEVWQKVRRRPGPVGRPTGRTGPESRDAQPGHAGTRDRSWIAAIQPSATD